MCVLLFSETYFYVLPDRFDNASVSALPVRDEVEEEVVEVVVDPCDAHPPRPNQWLIRLGRLILNGHSSM